MTLRGVVAAGLVLAACGKPSPPPVEAGASRTAVPAEAATLGNELFELLDRAVEFRAAHMGRPATTLRDLGIDSLTPETARALDSSAPIAFSTALRRPAGEVSACRASEDVLEQASLNEGRFVVECETADGPRSYEVSRPVAAAKR